MANCTSIDPVSFPFEWDCSDEDPGTVVAEWDLTGEDLGALSVDSSIVPVGGSPSPPVGVREGRNG